MYCQGDKALASLTASLTRLGGAGIITIGGVGIPTFGGLGIFTPSFGFTANDIGI
jgi:hypothetical protein